MNKAQAYNSFWNSFGLKAYDETSVPAGTEMPYITYEGSEDNFNHSLALTASVWYRSSSWVDCEAKFREIDEAIGRGGLMMGYDDGAFWIRKGTPWAIRQGEEDDSVRRIVLNIELEFID